MRVLTLAQNYEPIGTMSWKKAVALIFLNKATVLEEYSEKINSINFSMNIPSVIVLKGGKVRRVNSVRFSRKNVWLRDGGKCQYCRSDMTVGSFTVDHVIPKAYGGKTSWDNVVVSCHGCNQKKGDKSLKDSGLKLWNAPKKPNSLPFVSEINGLYNENFLHPSWKFWLNK
jgi:5-methylcytosine-specific restriction endonuclease McrA